MIGYAFETKIKNSKEIVVMAKLFTCPTCNRSISVNATSCPQCGENQFIFPTGETKSFDCKRHGDGSMSCVHCWFDYKHIAIKVVDARTNQLSWYKLVVARDEDVGIWADIDKGYEDHPGSIPAPYPDKN